MATQVKNDFTGDAKPSELREGKHDDGSINGQKGFKAASLCVGDLDEPQQKLISSELQTAVGVFSFLFVCFFFQCRGTI